MGKLLLSALSEKFSRRVNVTPLSLPATQIPADTDIIKGITDGMPSFQVKEVFTDPTFGIFAPGGCGFYGLTVSSPTLGNFEAIQIGPSADLTGVLNENGQTVFTFNTYGRYNNNPTAWDPLRTAVAGIAAMDPLSNLGMLLAVLTKYPKLPFQGPATIPVIPCGPYNPLGVSAAGSVPVSPVMAYLPLSALFSWQTDVPHLFLPTSMIVVTQDTGTKNLKLAIWDENRNEVDAQTAKLSGHTSYRVVSLFRNRGLHKSGFLEVTPYNTTTGIQVQNVRMF